MPKEEQSRKEGQALPTLTVQEAENNDVRSHERTFKVCIENNTDRKYRIVALLPYHAEDVQILERLETSVLKLERKRRKLCEELTKTLDTELFFATKGLRERRKADLMDFISGLVGDIVGRDLRNFTTMVWRILYKLTQPSIRYKAAKHFVKRYKQSMIEVESADQATQLLDMAQESATRSDPKLICIDGHMMLMLRGKIEQLRHVEDGIAQHKKENRLILLNVGEVLEDPWTFSFPRRLLSTRKFEIEFEALFTSSGLDELTKKASASVEIAPRDTVLSILAVIFGAVGGLIRFSTEDIFEGVWNATTSLTLLEYAGFGAVLGFVAFISYERIWPQIATRMLPNWRTAVLIGLISGILVENVLGAMKGFVLGSS